MKNKNASHLTAANSRARLSPEKLANYSEAAMLACREAGAGATFQIPDSFPAAFAVYERVFESTPVCPASAAFSAAVEAARAAVYGKNA